MKTLCSYITNCIKQIHSRNSKANVAVHSLKDKLITVIMATVLSEVDQ